MCVNFGYRKLCYHCQQHMNWVFLRQAECQKYKRTGSCGRVRWMKDKSWLKRKRQSRVCTHACQGPKTSHKAEAKRGRATAESSLQSRRALYKNVRERWIAARSA